MIVLEELLKTENIGETPLAKYWWLDEKVLYAHSKSTNRNIETVSENIAFVKSQNDNKPVKLVITIANSGMPDKATRDFVARELPNVYSAMAMLAPSKLTGFIVNVIYGLKKPPIPMRTFTDIDKAYKWITELELND